MTPALAPPYARLIAVAMAVGMTACSSSSPPPTVTPAAVPMESPTPIVRAPAPTPAIVGDPFERGVDKAASATNLSQSAQTPEDWDLVISQWQRAIGLMKAVPASSPNRAAARRLLEQYQESLAQAQVQAKRGGPRRTAPVVRDDGQGIPFIAGGSPQATPTGQGSQEAAIAIGTLNQRQIEFFSKQKRFAANLKELGGGVADSGLYSYATVAVQPTQAMSTATPKQAGLLSYTGAVFVIKDEKGNVSTASATCISAEAAQAPPVMPQLVGKEIKCPAGSSAL